MKKESAKGAELRAKILALTEEYYKAEHIKPIYKEGEPIPYGGRIYDREEITNLVSSALDFWLTSGPWTERFEKEFAEFLGVKYCSLVNSGSSANLLAFAALTSPKLGEKKICKGDEVITLAAGFPTTVTPILQYGAVPVFVDVDPFVRAAYDVGVGRETAVFLNRVDVLYAECLAVADQCAGVLRMERILHTDGHVTRPVGECCPHGLGSFGQHESR